VASVADFRLTKAVAYVRAHCVTGSQELVVNLILPFHIYSCGSGSLGDELALMAASTPPIFWSIITFIREGKVDAISIMVLTGIALSLLAFVGSGGVKFLQLRENLVTGFVALIFLGSAAIGRPLIYQLGPGLRGPSWRRSIPSLHCRRDPMLGIWALGRMRAQLRVGLHGLDRALPLDRRSHHLCNYWDADCLDILVPAVLDASRRCTPRN